MRLKEHLAAIGAKGGSQNTIAQMEARDTNLAKARQKRWDNLKRIRKAKAK